MTSEKRHSKVKQIFIGFIILFAVLFLLGLLRGFSSGSQWLLYFDKRYEGQVIEADTKKPIEGAVVVALWPLDLVPSQGYGGYAKIIVETTDKDGRFKTSPWVNFKPWRLSSVIRKEYAPKIVIYKPGYTVYSSRRIEREGNPTDYQMPEKEKAAARDRYNLNPAKLNKVDTDEEIWKEYREFRSQAEYRKRNYSENQQHLITKIFQKAARELPDRNNEVKKRFTEGIKSYSDLYK